MESEKKRERRQECDGGDDDYSSLLLEDLVFEEILPRLPARSLVRFKRVSKSWLRHISDPRFVSDHLRRQSRTAKLSVVDLVDSPNAVLIVDHRRNKVGITHLTNQVRKFAGRFQLYYAIGSCNGLVCLCVRHAEDLPQQFVVLQNTQEDLVLWNPETGEGRNTMPRTLPRSFFWGRRGEDYPFYGFGFDESRSDYRTVRVVPTQPTLPDFEVFSWNTGRWRRFEKGLSGYTVCAESSNSVHLNGCLYWLVLKVESANRRRCILSFDLCTDEYRVIDALKDRAPYIEGPFRNCLAKWKDSCVAYLSFPVDQSATSKGFEFRLVLDGKGDVVRDQGGSSSAGQLSFAHGRFWKFCGVSRDRFFVAEDVTRGAHSKKLVMYGFPGRDYTNVGRREAFTLSQGYYIGTAHDYVPSLVSVYPDWKTMMEARKKMEVRHWVDLFWRTSLLNKEKVGIPC